VSEPSPVVVTGIGVVSPFGWGTDAFWDGLVGGVSALAPVRRFEPAVHGRLAGEVPARAVGEVARSAAGRRMDWTSLMALGACRLALEDAGLAPEELSGERTSLVLGSAHGNLQETATFLDRLFARGSGNPLLFPNMVFNAPLAYASIELGIQGETAMLSMLEVSGEAAIGWGVDTVAAGRAEVCLAGGVDELGAVLHRVLEDGAVLAPGAPRPFARNADGIAAGEGAAVLVLEPLERAERRGARIHARLRAPLAFTVPAPVHGWPRDSRPIARGLRSVLAEVSVVFASASGNLAHDAIEGEALMAATRAPVTAIRATIGDFGAAGALAAAAAARALAAGVIPPTLGTAAAPGELDLAVGAARHTRLRSAVVMGLGRGGLVRALRFDAA
jgi:3-oxoacyl-[acyl-carrier-protein] synthase II